jgi:hypothetical protein
VVADFRKVDKTLDAPKCRTCELAMEWYRAALTSKEPKVIANYFACASCDEIVVLDHALQPEVVTPPQFLRDDLTAPERTVWLARTK